MSRKKSKKPHKRQRHRESCERKVKHPNKEEAEQAATMYCGVEVYKCMWCNFYHLGHPPDDKRVRDRDT